MFLNLKQIFMDDSGQYIKIPLAISIESIACIYPSQDYAGGCIIVSTTGSNFLVDTPFHSIQDLIKKKVNSQRYSTYIGWMPCTEMLPDVDDDYIVSLGNDLLKSYSVDIDTFKRGKWKTYGKKVLAWMPFPEPFK